MIEPILSVCIITYNHEKFIAQAIESILNQNTTFPFEIVIGEDCSKDKTRQICESYKKDFPQKIRLLESKMNLGMKQNLIRTLKDCEGKYIALLEGDDYWTDQLKLQRQVDFMDKHPECFLISHALPSAKDNTEEGWYDLKRLYQVFYLPHTSNFLFRNFDVEKYKQALLNFIGGEICLLYIAATEGLIYHSSKEVSFYRHNPDGVHTSKSIENKIRTRIKQNYLVYKYFKVSRQMYYRRRLDNYKNFNSSSNINIVDIRLWYYLAVLKFYSYWQLIIFKFKKQR
jgi:glycosyltransferase involved in cell wall biosynthesis